MSDKRVRLVERVRSAYQALIGGQPVGVNYYTGPTATGIQVTNEQMMAYAPVFACVRIISEDIGAMPLHLYRRTDKGREIARDHPVDKLMRNPNPRMIASVYRETMMGAVLLWGNAYAEIEYDADYKPIALWPIHPSRVTPKRADSGGHDIFYEVRLPDGKTQTLNDWQMLHLIGYSEDGLVGRSVLSMVRETVGLGIAAQEFGARYFGNGANMGGFIEVPGLLSEQAYNRFKADINEKYEGLKNSHRIILLEEGAKWSKNTIPPEDAQMLQTRKYQLEEVARFYRVPLHLLQSLERATNNNIEHQSIDYSIHCLLPWTVKIEQANERRLLTEDERETYFVKHNMDGMLRGDTKSRYEAYAVGRQWGWLSANDVREKEDMNAIEGGDVYLVPMNMVPADQIEAPPDEDFEQGATRRAEVRSTVTDAAMRYAQQRLETILTAERALADTLAGQIATHCETLGGYVQYVEAGAPERFAALMSEYLRSKDVADRLSAALSSTLPGYAEQIRAALQSELGSVLADSYYQAAVRDFIDAAAKSYSSRSIGQLKTIIAEGRGKKRAPAEIAERLRAKLLDWKNNRAGQIGSNESVKMANMLTRKAAKEKGYRVIWQVMSGSPCQFCAALNGVTVEAGGIFHSEKKGHKRRLNPPLHNGCHCMLVVETK